MLYDNREGTADASLARSTNAKSSHGHSHSHGCDVNAGMLECAACSASFSFGTVFKNLLLRERKLVVGLYRRQPGVGSLPYVILCPSFGLKLEEGDRIFVLYRDETPAGRKGGRDQAKRRERKLSMNASEDVES